MIAIIPSVLSTLQKEGLMVDFCNLIRLISQQKFPLKNISFLLVLEVARWYSQKRLWLIRFALWHLFQVENWKGSEYFCNFGRACIFLLKNQKLGAPFPIINDKSLELLKYLSQICLTAVVDKMVMVNVKLAKWGFHTTRIFDREIQLLNQLLFPQNFF